MPFCCFKAVKQTFFCRFNDTLRTRSLLSAAKVEVAIFQQQLFSLFLFLQLFFFYSFFFDIFISFSHIIIDFSLIPLVFLHPNSFFLITLFHFLSYRYIFSSSIVISLFSVMMRLAFRFRRGATNERSQEQVSCAMYYANYANRA